MATWQYALLGAILYFDAANFSGQFAFMPTLSIFDGIKIIIMILEGNLPRPERTKVLAWAALHQAELRANWELARGGRQLLAIEPLD